MQHDKCKVLKIGTSRHTDHSVSINEHKLDVVDEFSIWVMNSHQKVITVCYVTEEPRNH